MKKILVLIIVSLLIGNSAFAQQGKNDRFGNKDTMAKCVQISTDVSKGVTDVNKYTGDEISFQFFRYETRNDGSIMLDSNSCPGVKIVILKAPMLKDNVGTAMMKWYTAKGTVTSVDATSKTILVDHVEEIAVSAR